MRIFGKLQDTWSVGRCHLLCRRTRPRQLCRRLFRAALTKYGAGQAQGHLCHSPQFFSQLCQEPKDFPALRLRPAGCEQRGGRQGGFQQLKSECALLSSECDIGLLHTCLGTLQETRPSYSVDGAYTQRVNNGRDLEKTAVTAPPLPIFSLPVAQSRIHRRSDHAGAKLDHTRTSLPATFTLRSSLLPLSQNLRNVMSHSRTEPQAHSHS